MAEFTEFASAILQSLAILVVTFVGKDIIIKSNYLKWQIVYKFELSSHEKLHQNWTYSQKYTVNCKQLKIYYFKGLELIMIIDCVQKSIFLEKMIQIA